MNKVVRVRDRGDITIPKALRRKLGIEPGDVLDVVDTEQGELLITRRKVVPRKSLEAYEQWQKRREAFFDQMQEVSERANLSEEEANQLVNGAIAAVRANR